MRAFSIFFLAVSMIVAVPFVAAAQQASPDPNRVRLPEPAEGRAPEGDGWKQNCQTLPDETQLCDVYSRIQDEIPGELGSTFTVLHAAVGPGPEGTTTFMLLVTPLGTLLSPGMLIQIDGNPAKLVHFMMCLPDGCQARLEADPGLIAELMRGQVLNVTVSDITGRRVDIPMSLEGFRDAFKNLPERS